MTNKTKKFIHFGKRHYRFIASVLFILIIYALFIAITKVSSTSITLPTASLENGVTDLTDFNFKKSAAFINHTSIINGLLTPTEMENVTGNQWKHTDEIGTITVKTVALLPNDKEYVIFFNSPDFASRIYINGELREDVGKVGYSYETTVPKTEFCYYYVRPVNGKVTVVVQSANYYNAEAANAYVQVADPFWMQKYLAQMAFRDMIMIGVLFTAFIIQFGFFLFYPEIRANLYFALLCLTACLRSGMLGNRIWVSIMPDMSWFVLYKGEYLSVCLLCIFAALFVDYHFNKIMHKPIKWVIVLISVAYGIVVVATKPLVFTSYLEYYQLFLGITMGYVLIMLLWNIKKYSFDRYYSLTGIVIFFIATIQQIIYIDNPFFNFLDGLFHSIGLDQGIVYMLIFILVQILASFFRIQTDITEAREAKRLLTAKNELLDKLNLMKTQFLGNVSHELKTPLTIVSNYAQLTTQKLIIAKVDDITILQNLKSVSSEVKRMALMVNQLLDVAFIEETNFKCIMNKVDISKLIDTLMSTYYPVINKNHNSITVDILDSLPCVSADSDRITQVIVNLVANSAKFTQNGKITVSAKLIEENRLVQISVADTGCGMDNEQLLHISERFYTSQSGTGLGLYICKHIIEAHQSQLKIESSLGKGTIVLFNLPVFIAV